MNTVFFDSHQSDSDRRKQLYDGQLFVFSPVPSATALCALGRRLAEEAFAPLDPRVAQDTLSVEAFAAILADLKPKFIHHPDAKKLIPGIFRELGCDLDKMYFDLPRMRTATHHGYLTSGIAYAFHPHRDTWYSAPSCQVNWWLPIYDVTPENVMAFHPGYWNRPVRNGSADYNYYEWNKVSRKNAAQHIKTERVSSLTPTNRSNSTRRSGSFAMSAVSSSFLRRICIPPCPIHRAKPDSASISEPSISMMWRKNAARPMSIRRAPVQRFGISSAPRT